MRDRNLARRPAKGAHLLHYKKDVRRRDPRSSIEARPRAPEIVRAGRKKTLPSNAGMR
jgi:hypothetical protein